MTALVFVNYRSNDAGWAVHLDDALSAQYGPDTVFRASRSIAPGDDFIDSILAAVAGARVLVAVIGPGWLRATNREGRRALDQPEDWVRREIAQAFASDVTVLPVLVDATAPLDGTDLPGDIARLARCQYVRVSYRTSAADVRRVVDEVRKLAPDLPLGDEHPAAAGGARRRRVRFGGSAVAAAALAGGASAAVAAYGGPDDPSDTSAQRGTGEPGLAAAPEPHPSLTYQAATQSGEQRPTFSSYLDLFDKGVHVPGGTWVDVSCRWQHASESASVGDWWYLLAKAPWRGRWVVANSYVTRTTTGSGGAAAVTHRYDGRSDPDVDFTIPLCDG